MAHPGPRRASAIVWMVAFAIALRLLVAVLAYHRGGLQSFHAPQSREHLQLAQSLLDNGSYSSSGAASSGSAAELVRTPGYSALLIPGILLRHVEAVTIAIQIALSGATVFLLYRLARCFSNDDRVSLCCAGLYALEPLSVTYSCYLLTETSLTFCIVAMLYALCCYFRTDQSRYVLGAAAAIAAATYLQPVAYYLPALITAGLLARALTQGNAMRRDLVQVARFALICALLLAPWHARNYLVAGYSGFSARRAEALYFHHGAAIMAKVTGQPVADVQAVLGLHDPEQMYQMHPEWRDLPAAKRFDRMEQSGQELINSHTWLSWQLRLKDCARALSNPGGSDLLTMFRNHSDPSRPDHDHPDQSQANHSIADATATSVQRARLVLSAASVVLGAVLLVYFVLAVHGCIRGRWHMSWPHALAFLLGSYFVAMSGIPDAAARHRHPVMALLCIFAAYGAAALAAAARPPIEHSPRAAAPAAEPTRRAAAA